MRFASTKEHHNLFLSGHILSSVLVYLLQVELPHQKAV